jgi:hypothetical protein
MERSAKQRFLEQTRLTPRYIDCATGRNKSSPLRRIISAVGVMCVLILAVAVTYLSR